MIYRYLRFKICLNNSSNKMAFFRAI
uniref:Uncharacterized protein n=1 Tax=Anguilla anguilla TaxID=7936 RepID=A0A0E9UJ29_ANGAN